MRIDEFSAADENQLPFSVIDDLTVFMRNDPMFYRKQLFPAIIKMKNSYDNNKKMDPAGIFGSVVDRAIPHYCKKFQIPKRPDELLDDKDRDELIQKLYSEELTNIKKGVY